MEIFWAVVFIISSPAETHVIRGYGDKGHYATKEECLAAAGEEALDFVHQMYVATRCEPRLGPETNRRVRKIEKYVPPPNTPNCYQLGGSSGVWFC
jgi:hypothetical protein